MMDIKKNLKTYMVNFPGSFVGFFELVSDVVRELGEDWLEHSKTNEDHLAKKWSSLFIDTSKTLKQISESFSSARDEFEKRESEPDDPVTLINDFKNKILKEIHIK